MLSIIEQSLVVVLSATMCAAQVTVPPGCDAPATQEITSFEWFNSTHNLDCPSANYPAGSEVCWNSTSLCNKGDESCTCTPFCYTGLPTVAYQPLGYGPPDNITISTTGGSCTGIVSTGFRDREIGEGSVNCGTAADVMDFYGDSNMDAGNNGSLVFRPYGLYCGDSENDNLTQLAYGGSFPLVCSRDDGGERHLYNDSARHIAADRASGNLMHNR
ncbi:hypothetical protein N0V93_002948 [Gnomoniopsis smithogilvyi]|uniref:Uncharacterized protein n=1 Tax=Gnomoniopsis smithogilvyi TaxID=1191159 RepID=A0A9W9CZJ0_9PEZI|nr:hypothetical protein N0V93_002948 [Gnomoniopsis smithogilvyi]